jgi:hypothetical protein
MSGKRITWLAGLLVVQLLIVAALLLARDGVREAETGPLLTFDVDAVDGIRIEESGDAAIELKRTESGWTLADGIPADGEKIGALLKKLAGLQASWPVATTASARERFEVDDDNRQRVVRVLSGDRTVAELLLGTSPGFRRLHVRLPGADEIYDVDLAHFDLSTSADEWIDRALLAADGEVSAVAREGRWRLARSDEGWLLDDGAADAAKAEAMVGRFANLRVLGVASPEGAGEGAEGAGGAAETGQPAAVFVVTDGQGEHRLTLFGNPDAAEYVVESSRRAGRFRLATFVAEQVLVEGAALLPGGDEEGEAAAAGADAGPAAANEATAADVPLPAPEDHDHDH